MLKRLLSGWLSAALVLAGCGLTWAALVPAQSQARACGRDAVNESSACRLVIANHSRVLSKVTATTADLQVTVAWTGRPATYGFQYGDTTPYDATVTTAGPRSSDGRTVLMRAQISGLTPDTLYRFVAYAHSSRGWSYTTVGSFRTTPERHPTVPSPAPASGAGRTVAPTASAATATTTTTTPSGSTPAPAAPTGPTMLWGAQIGSQFTGNEAPWDMNAVSDFAAMVGKAPS
ncbi:MAG: fibronectin type III domain-containing protein, partial [Solirubrobacteraceae bacterium]